ncbi:YbbR-like domain-containing protein [Chloroflexota bacterium]
MDIPRKLLNNLGTVILSLLLAFVVWIAATFQLDPFTEQAFAGVPLAYLNQPDGTEFYNAEDVAERVDVLVRAPESVLKDLRPSDFEATVDLATVPVGEPSQVAIDVRSFNDAIRILEYEPQAEVVHLEVVVAITVPVTIDVQGEVATGYRVSTLEVVPEEVLVRGPELTVGDVVSATGTLDAAGAREDVVSAIPLVVVNAQGEVVAGLELSPDAVVGRLAVRRKLGFKPDVEVVPDLRGSPAPGYRLGSVTVDPQSVTLTGLPSVLEDLPGFVETLPISVTDATEDLEQRTTLTLPPGVVAYGQHYVSVVVEVFPIESSRAATAVVEVEGVPLGWIATPSPPEVDVILEGPDTFLAGLKPGDLRVSLSLFGFPLGIHRVEPQVLAPEGVRVVSVIPETIEVVIEQAPTPTPVGDPTPTATPGS